MAKKAQKDTKLVGASYVVGFYQDIERLNHSYVQYLNLLLEYREKYGDLSKCEEEEQHSVKESLQTLRYYVLKIYAAYNSLAPRLGVDVQKDIKDGYEAMKKSFFIDEEVMEKYVLQLNEFLLGEVIKDLLQTSQDILGDIYEE